MSTNLQKSTPRSAVILSDDSTPLHATVWPVEEPRAVLLIAHGVGEHGGCYGEVAVALQSALPDLEILRPSTFEATAGVPAIVDSSSRYDELIDDLRPAVRWLQEHRPDVPVFLLGHSNGGQVALRLALSDQNLMAGIDHLQPGLDADASGAAVEAHARSDAQQGRSASDPPRDVET